MSHHEPESAETTSHRFQPGFLSLRAIDIWDQLTLFYEGYPVHAIRIPGLQPLRARSVCAHSHIHTPHTQIAPALTTKMSPDIPKCLEGEKLPSLEKHRFISSKT